ncbi:MAG: FAD-binding oxidoreductase [Candidatus Liptonbacteria bacterium]|nr:FAD-binding oxidoreductase [Candidatus Liptonbacteria bacterium]
MDISELKKLMRDNFSDDSKTLDAYSVDASIFSIRPEAVVFPKDVRDIRQLVKWVIEKKKNGEHISLTGRSAGTDMSGGPLNDSIIVSFTKYFNRIKEITALPSNPAPKDEQKHSNILQNIRISYAHPQDGYAIVEPGVYFRDFEKELDSRGLLYPPYPASKDFCAIGGMVLNNSGGEKTLEYGKTEDYVESLKIVLNDGEEHELKPLSAGELREKIAEKTFEGELYRRLYELIEKNYDEIQKAKPDVSKNSAGYALWNVWNRKTFDIIKLIVGSQGTLGLVTEAKLRLVKKKKFSKLVVIFAKSLEPVPELVKSLLAVKPESIESYDNKTLELALKFFPSMLKLMKGNIVKLAWDFLPELWMVLRGGVPKMILLVELSSDSEEELNEKINSVRQSARKFPVQARVVKNKNEEEKYWTIRRQSFALLHSHVKGLEAAPFVDDIIVKPEYLAEVLPKVNEILAKHKDKLIYTIAGHPGNGNFHIIPLVNLKDPGVPKIIKESMDEIYKLVLSYGGSITAEHNDGLIRGPYLEMMYGEKICKLFAEVKNIFDPLDIFNPGKKVGSEWKYSSEHIKK